MFDEEQQIENPPRATVAVCEWMDRLELVVHDREPDQRIDAVIRMDVALPIGEFVAEQFGALGWSVNHSAGRLVQKRRAWGCADIEVYSFDGPTDLDGAPRRKRLVFKLFKP